MRPQHVRAASPTRPQFGRAPFQFALLLTSVVSAKLLHLYSHLNSLPPLLILLYTPTFVAIDVVSAVLFWILVHLQAPGRLSIALTITKCLICLTLLGASAAQITFYVETGGEVKWGAAKSVANDPAGMGLLLSGSVPVFLVSVVISAVARLVCNPLYSKTKSLLCAVARTLPSRRLQSLALSRESGMRHCDRGSDIPFHSIPDEEDGLDAASSSDEDEFESKPVYYGQDLSFTRRWFNRTLVVAPIVTVTILFLVRPVEFPYAHMSGSLPFTLLEIWRPESPDMCRGGSFAFTPFPRPDLLAESLWEPAHDDFVGWMPTADGIPSNTTENQHLHRPSWLPKEKIPGFDRWYDGRSPKGMEDATRRPPPPPPDHGPPPPPPDHGPPPPPGRRPPPPHFKGGKTHKKPNDGPDYNPVEDPMRITNLDHDIFGSVSETLKNNKVSIKHVVMLSLESTRKDVFPFKKGSHMHDKVMETHGSKESAERANEELAKLTVNAEILTGEASGFEFADGTGAVENSTSWRNLQKDKGGINVVGAITGSTSTLKSILGSHCGVQPLPVDFTVEARSRIYQPCMPNVLKLFSHTKKSQSSEGRESKPEKPEKDFISMPWKTLFVQAITDQFDHEDELNEHIGFSEVVAKRTLMDPSSKFFPPTEEESNYFGYPETQVKPYLRDAFIEAQKNNQRLFLSHLTSSTHHPWNTPESGGPTFDYMQPWKWLWMWPKEQPLNRYLNTVRYGDGWIGEIMDMLEEFGVAEETLVVLVGDHGMAFQEDSPTYTTFENGHVSNLRVPLTFFHPSLPRIQLAVNATSMSIVPTVLDLLISTSSLDGQDMEIASNLIQQYEGQSLLRPYQIEKNGRQAWNMGIINAGGAVLSVASAAVPFRLIIPVCKPGVYRFTSTLRDPNEINPIEENSIADLAKEVGRLYDDNAAKWVLDAEQMGKWWVMEQRRRWNYHGASLQDDRSPEELLKDGKKKLEHWWDT